MRITILNLDYPTNLSIQLFRIPTHCAFKNIKFDNCRCIGMAPQPMKDMLFASSEFTRCGQTSAKCALDAEDGWDMMQDATFRSLNFYNNPYNELLTCAGHNFIIENMVAGKVYFWERTNSYVVKNSLNLTGATLGRTTRLRTGYTRFFNNTVNNGMSIGATLSNNWPFTVKDCIINGSATNNIGAGMYLRCNIGASLLATDSYMTALGTGNFKNCYIHDKKGQNSGGIYDTCTLENISGNLHYSFNMNNCNITNFNGTGGGYTPSYIFNNCVLTNFQIQFGYWYEGATTSFNNCEIINTSFLLKLPHYSMKYPITLTNNKFSSTSTVGMINFFDDRVNKSVVPQNILKLDSNNITLTNSQYIVTGLTKNTVNNINIVSSNSIYLPSTLVLCNPDARLCPNITIIES